MLAFGLLDTGLFGKGHVLKPKTTTQNHQNKTTETSKTTEMREWNKITETSKTSYHYWKPTYSKQANQSIIQVNLSAIQVNQIASL